VFRSRTLFVRLLNSFSALRSRGSAPDLQEPAELLLPERAAAMQFAGRGVSSGQSIELSEPRRVIESPPYRPATFMESNLLYCDIHGSAARKCVDECDQDHAELLATKLRFTAHEHRKAPTEDQRERQREKRRREQEERTARGGTDDR
jgi:hypothetical protein